MKKDIHPEYKEVVFQDVQSDFKFLTRSTMTSDEKIKWEDGKEYPLIKVEVSSASHPFYTGKKIFVDTAGRVEKFNQKYKAKQAAAKPPVKEEAPAAEAPKEEAPAAEAPKEEASAAEETSTEETAEAPKEEAPAAEETSTEETVEAPKEEAPAAEETSTEETAEAPKEEAPAAEESATEENKEDSTDESKES